VNSLINSLINSLVNSRIQRINNMNWTGRVTGTLQ
jgi:hypothetical protein